MSITEKDINRIAQSASLKLNSEQITSAQTKLNSILTLINQLQTIDTENVQPMVYPSVSNQATSLRLRPDTPSSTFTIEQRDRLMSNAPATSDGLFLVPTVIE